MDARLTVSLKRPLSPLDTAPHLILSATNINLLLDSTIDQAINKVNEIRKTLGCEPANAEEIELRVNAQVLPRSGGKIKSVSP